MKSSFIVFLTIFIFACKLHAGTTYYSPEGKVVSKQQFEVLQKEHAKKVRIASEKQKTGALARQNATRDNSDLSIPVDYLGRPLKTHDGRWITYPGEESRGASRYNSNSVITRTKSYRENSSSMRKMIDARKADKYKERYIKSGKTTDLHKYREALKEYYSD